MCGGAYPLKQWVPTSQSQSAEGSTQSPTDSKKLLGVKEGEWLRKWEGVIIQAVRMGYQSPRPLNGGFTGPVYVGVAGSVVASDLDGYND